MMKKLLFLLAFAAVALVGCNVKELIPEIPEFTKLAYSVTFGSTTTPKGLLAVEITYADEKGAQQTKTVTENWRYDMPNAKKGDVLEYSWKIVLAPGQKRPTEGEVNVKYSLIAAGIVGTDILGLEGLLNGKSKSVEIKGSYNVLNTALDVYAANPYTGEYVVKVVSLFGK